MFKALIDNKQFTNYKSSGFKQLPLIYCADLCFDSLAVKNFFNSLQDPAKIILESNHPDQSHSFSIIGINHFQEILVKNSKVYHNKKEITSSEPLSYLEHQLAKFHAPRVDHIDIPFIGGAIGFFSYEANRFFEKIPLAKKNNLDFFDFAFWFFDQVFIFDHLKNRIFISVCGEDFEHTIIKYERLSNLFKLFFKPACKAQIPVEVRKPNLEHFIDYRNYESCIHKIKEFIAAGHSYQVNFSQIFRCQTSSNPWDIYCKLNEINPVNYAAFFSVEDFTVVCGSPERLVKRVKNKVFSRPIAGTRKLSENLLENKKFMDELKNDPKEQAEHAMLVDLCRNDLGRFCLNNSVKIKEYASIAKYKHVMHLESEIVGDVLETTEPLEILGSIFPGGTITGVPKIRTMEIISELEEQRRGIYTGSIGYISYTKDMDFNIVIRSILFKNQEAFIQTGGGITFDSDVKLEYKETLNKARSQFMSFFGNNI